MSDNRFTGRTERPYKVEYKYNYSLKRWITSIIPREDGPFAEALDFAKKSLSRPIDFHFIEGEWDLLS